MTSKNFTKQIQSKMCKIICFYIRVRIVHFDFFLCVVDFWKKMKTGQQYLKFFLEATKPITLKFCTCFKLIINMVNPQSEFICSALAKT